MWDVSARLRAHRHARRLDRLYKRIDVLKLRRLIEGRKVA